MKEVSYFSNVKPCRVISTIFSFLFIKNTNKNNSGNIVKGYNTESNNKYYSSLGNSISFYFLIYCKGRMEDD